MFRLIFLGSKPCNTFPINVSEKARESIEPLQMAHSLLTFRSVYMR